MGEEEIQPDAQQFMLINIPVNFGDSIPNAFRESCATEYVTDGSTGRRIDRQTTGPKQFNIWGGA